MLNDWLVWQALCCLLSYPFWQLQVMECWLGGRLPTLRVCWLPCSILLHGRPCCRVTTLMETVQLGSSTDMTSNSSWLCDANLSCQPYLAWPSMHSWPCLCTHWSTAMVLEMPCTWLRCWLGPISSSLFVPCLVMHSGLSGLLITGATRRQLHL